MDPEEKAIQGWGNIAAIFGVHPRTMMRRKEELKQAGVIFYMTLGQPKRRVVCAFPSLLRTWISRKAAKGEDF